MLLDGKINSSPQIFYIFNPKKNFSWIHFTWSSQTVSKINQKDDTPKIVKNIKVEFLLKKTLDKSRTGRDKQVNREPCNRNKIKVSILQQWGGRGEMWYSINNIEKNVHPLGKIDLGLIPCSKLNSRFIKHI